MSPSRLIVTCEHGGNLVPARYRHLFRDKQRLLNSHRGYDPGSLELARRFSRQLKAPLFFSRVTRLLVELNRSIGHPRLFSEITRDLGISEKQAILATHYYPYRSQVQAVVAAAIERGESVVHLSVHTFTPTLAGVVRNADIGLLYDPARPREKALGAAWRRELRRLDGKLCVRRNYPYRGSADGFVTDLRQRHGRKRYVGVELEVNQRLVYCGGAAWRRLQQLVINTFSGLLARSRGKN